MAIFNELGESVEPVNIDTLDETPTNTDDSDISGGKEQEFTEPASDTEDEDAEQEVTEPDGESRDVADEVASEDGAENKPQSKAENRRQAAARRQREAEELKATAQDEVIKSMNIMNPATGKPFETYKEYTDAHNAAKQSKIRMQLEQKGIDTAAIDKLIEEHPAVVEAKKVTEAAAAAEAAATKEKENARFDKMLADVKRVIPEIKDASDLFKWDGFKKFSLLVNGGISPLEAAQTLAGERRAAASRQAALNSIASKSHLVNIGKTSSGGYSITDEQFEMFRSMNPDATREEATAAYKKYGG